MKTILTAERDPMGAAILEFQKTGRAGNLRVLSSLFDEDRMPVKHLFRSIAEMPELERKALEMVEGYVLDVGAGSGCHSLVLQEAGKQVKAIDISPLSCEAMRLRGVKDVDCVNLFDTNFKGGFDTILLLMNGTGIAGKLANLPQLFMRLKMLLNPDGKILIDSSDLKYLYETEDGSYDFDTDRDYYGEVDYQMVYRKVRGDCFDWLYVDFPMLKAVAESCGLEAQLVANGPHYDYLACLKNA